MKTAPESRKISTILRALREKTLVPQPNFQRRAVWTNKDKIAFIDTILQGYPFPEIYVAVGEVDTQTGDATELLVDGQQRVRTIDEYFRGVSPFSRPQSIKKYSDLIESEKKDFLNYDVSVRNIGIVDIDTIRIVFQRMNATSYDLNEMERYNAVYLGEFKKFCEEYANNDLFKEWRLFSSTDIRRMKDVSYIASLVATMMSDYFHRDDEIEEFLDRYNETFPEKESIRQRIDGTLGAIAKFNFPKDSRARRKADFYTLFVEVDRRLNRDGVPFDIAQASAKISDLYRDVDRARDTEGLPEIAMQYYQATLQSTNDRGTRATRGSVIREILVEC